MNTENNKTLHKYYFEAEYIVSAHDTDIRNNCKLTNILNYLQETSARHALKFGVDAENLIHNNVGWVLSRLKIQMYKYPKWQEKVIIRTWTRGSIGILCYRDFEILNSNGDTIGKATSAWLIIDILERKPIKPDSFIKSFPNYPQHICLTSELKKLPKQKELEEVFTIPVMYSDVDINHHVNNVKYARWQVDAIPVSLLIEKPIKDFEIDFLHEAKLGEKITISCKKNEDIYYTCTHSKDIINSRAIIKF